MGLGGVRAVGESRLRQGGGGEVRAFAWGWWKLRFATENVRTYWWTCRMGWEKDGQIVGIGCEGRKSKAWAEGVGGCVGGWWVGREGAHHEGRHVDNLFANADVALADEDARVVDRLSQAQLEDLRLQPPLQEVLRSDGRGEGSARAASAGRLYG